MIRALRDGVPIRVLLTTAAVVMVLSVAGGVGVTAALS